MINAIPRAGVAPGVAAPALLVAEGVSCTVGERCLFRDLDIALAPGALIEVRGRNGSGKSTLLRGLAGLQPFQAGRLARHADVEYLGHKAGLSDRLTLTENIRWSLAQRGMDFSAQAVCEAAIRVGLGVAADEPCGILSAGQRRRAALARLIVGAAKIWLLDEPSTALDDDGAALVRQLIAEHRRQGGGVVCATHGNVHPTADHGPFRTVALSS